MIPEKKMKTVLMVAEKPSLATSISNILSRYKLLLEDNITHFS